MILAYHPVFDCICMWFYNADMKVMYWDSQFYGHSEGEYNADDSSMHISLTDLRACLSNFYEVLYDDGAL